LAAKRNAEGGAGAAARGAGGGRKTGGIELAKRAVKKQSRIKNESTEMRFWRIHRVIRERICLLQYPPGSLLSELDLAQEFAVSRTPLRRVLQRLEYEGLVSIKNGVGTLVTDIDLRTLKDTYDVRIRLMLMVGELSPGAITEAQVKGMEALIARLEGLRAKPDAQAYAHISFAYHAIFLELIGNDPLREFTDLLYYRVARIWLTFLALGDWKDEVDLMEAEFTDVRDAMRRNDIKAIAKTRSDHIKGNLLRMSIYMAKQ
jgi:DNA-binding GntR family transcriptional regulator